MKQPTDPPARPTLRTLAAATGLAVATVSRALKDAPDIGTETKARVRAAALRLGYRPNRAGIRLRTGKTHVIALCLSPEAGVMNNTSQLMYSIAEALRSTTYHLMVMPFFADQDPMDPIRYLVETESADGVILNQTTPEDPRIRYLTDKGFPFATHGRTAMALMHDWCDFDNEAFARVGVRALVKAGRRDLLLVAPTPEHAYSKHMQSGFATEAAHLGARAEVLAGATSDTPGPALQDAVRAQLAVRDHDGFICGSTTATMASIAGAEAAGKIIGRDFDIVGKEAIPMLHMFRPAVHVVTEDVARAGRALAHALVRRIEDQDAPFLQEMHQPTEAVAHESHRKRAAE
ncbi:MAG: LacI family transcriptional regulator [Cypionkella sp.]|jgi:LacI family transcriptional regulator|nr:LacI family transcriptional regulator [Cypionkella sp.]